MTQYDDNINVHLWISKQQKSAECVDHWELRKEFLEKNFYNVQDKESLLCLAQLYVNIQTLGCRYSKEVLERVEKLSQGIGTEYKNRKTQYLQRTFVSASNVAESKIKARKVKQMVSIDDKQTIQSRFSRFVPAASSASNDSSQSERKKNVNNNSDIYFHSNKFAKMEQFNINYHQFSMSKTNPLQNINRKSRLDLSRHVIIFDPIVSYRQTGENFLLKSNIQNRIHIAENNNGQWYSSIEIAVNGLTVTLGKACGETKQITLDELYKQMLANFSEICRVVIKRRKSMSNKMDKIDLKDISGDNKESEFTYQPVSNSNIGAKLLKMMGWSGGGLGAHKDGIIEPVKAYDSFGPKKGIGFKSEVNKEELTKLLQNYLSSDTLEELIFSPDISKVTRACIHEIVKKNRNFTNLRSVSRNEKGNRYLTITKNYTPQELAEYLSEGCEDPGPFKLFLPGTIDLSVV